MKSIILFSIFIDLRFVFCLNYKFNTSQYFRMPMVYRFDDYEQCMGIYEDQALYCVVNAYIKPDSSSNLYNFIREFSNNHKQHFRHDKLQRGLCINTCEKILHRMGRNSETYFVKKFPMDTKLIFEFVEYFNAREHRENYDDVVNKCINIELMNRFNLSAYSSIEYCIKGDMRPPLDWLDIVTAGIIIVIFLLVMTSSIIDRILRNTTSFQSENHYKTKPMLLKHQIVTLFSLRRNWNILSAPTKPDFRDLRFIQSIRALTMFGVIIGHCGWFSIILPSYNPIFIEDIYSNVASMLVVNGINIVQTFFVIGGFLTSFFFMAHVEGVKESSGSLLLKAVILRYIRFAPLLFLTVLMHSTWLYRLGTGPVWDKVNFAERQFCRKNWWINMLFMDNYLKVEMKCLIHTWYLAADFWLSAFAVVFLIIINKKPALKYWLFCFILATSGVVTAYVTYIFKFEPVTIFSPENLRNQYFQANETELNYFKDFYTPTHMNFGNYFVGVIVGVIYYNLKKKNQNLSKHFFFRVVWYLCIVIGFMTTLSAYIFYKYDFEKPSVCISILSALLKHSWGLIIGLGALGVIYRYGWFMPNIFNYSGWRVLGRISYATFICHIFILKLLMSGIHQPMYLSVFNIMSYVCAVYGISNVVGFILTLSIEIPISSMCKMIFLKPSRDEMKSEIPMNENIRAS